MIAPIAPSKEALAELARQIETWTNALHATLAWLRDGQRTVDHDRAGVHRLAP
jgi:hypothetical protein